MQPKHEIPHLIERKESLIGKIFTFVVKCLKPLAKNIVKYTVMKTLFRFFEIGNKNLFSKAEFLTLSALLFAFNAMADSGPSLHNIKKNIAAGDEELKKIAHETFMQNVYMVVGFSVVIAIAWFSTTLAIKFKKKETEASRPRHQVIKQSSINARYPKRSQRLKGIRR